MRTLPCRLVAAGSLILPATALAQNQPGSLALAVDSALKLDSAAAVSPAAAPAPQSPGGGDTAWHFSITPYIWVPSFDGDVASNGVLASVDTDLGDAFNKLGDPRGGLGVHFEAGDGPWSFFADALYLKLDDDHTTGTEVDMKHAIVELGVAYALFDSDPAAGDGGGVRVVVEPLAGVRVQWLDMDINGAGEDQTWADAFGGGRIRISFDEPFSIYGRADFGGGMSDFTWSAAVGAEVSFAQWISLSLGYKWMKSDFDDGSGADFFQYDVLLQGPFLAVTIKF